MYLSFPISLNNPVIYSHRSNQKGHFRMSFRAPEVENVNLITWGFKTMFRSLMHPGQEYHVKGIFRPSMGMKCLHTAEYLLCRLSQP